MPVRTCIVCRGKAEKDGLLRFVLEAVVGPDWGAKSGVKNGAAGGKVHGSGSIRRLRLDVAHRLPGRGVYCHAVPACLGERKLTLLAVKQLRQTRRAAKVERCKRSSLLQERIAPGADSPVTAGSMLELIGRELEILEGLQALEGTRGNEASGAVKVAERTDVTKREAEVESKTSGGKRLSETRRKALLGKLVRLREVLSVESSTTGRKTFRIRL